LNLQDSSNGIISYQIGDVARTVSVSKQKFRSGSGTASENFTDLWWNPSESGWGLSIAHQADMMFLAWYTFDTQGKSTWYVASACSVQGDGCSGPLYRASGPPMSISFDPTAVSLTQVGSASLSFRDADNGTLSYTIDSRSGSMPITRFLF
jgi:hypothetical protein